MEKCKKYGANCHRKNLPNHNFWRENGLTRKGRKMAGRISAVTAFLLVNDVSYMFLLSASPKCLTTTREARVRLSSERLPVGMVT